MQWDRGRVLAQVHCQQWTFLVLRKMIASLTAHWPIDSACTLLLRGPCVEYRWGSFDLRWLHPLQEKHLHFYVMVGWKWQYLGSPDSERCLCGVFWRAPIVQIKRCVQTVQGSEILCNVLSVSMCCTLNLSVAQKEAVWGAAWCSMSLLKVNIKSFNIVLLDQCSAVQCSAVYFPVHRTSSICPSEYTV